MQLQEVVCGLAGEHQFGNATLAVAAAEVLHTRGFSVQPEDICSGIRQTTWPGRFETVIRNPLVILDSAHNPDAWRMLIKNLDNYFFDRNIIFVLGVMKDKNIKAMLSILMPRAAKTSNPFIISPGH